MAILPEGFALPPLPYLAVLVVGVVLVAGAVSRRRPTVTADRILAFAPWMVLGSALHVLYVIGGLPEPVRPLAGTPAVYLTVGIIAVGTWVVIDAVGEWGVARTLASVGGLLALGAVGGVLVVGAEGGTFAPAVPLAGLALAVVVAAAVWVTLTRLVPEIRQTGSLGALAVFAHVLDGVSTAVGIDVLGFDERTPLSRIIIEFAHGLPTEPLIGSGWLFVLVKIAVVSIVVWLFADFVSEEPTEAQVLLGVVAAVGLGPGVHNLLLFTVTTVP
ncbi:DUF63 family protein [Halobellus marinus]|jgi:uncharacterized membrane protein|uniref:DUF63 family protein n=1 Tax=Halobellus TaxID=1073986 RepID=UPI0028A98A63|nr:DUF63 family protein [Halobellus sp. DFY28]